MDNVSVKNVAVYTQRMKNIFCLKIMHQSNKCYTVRQSRRVRHLARLVILAFDRGITQAATTIIFRESKLQI